jgi:hypothetical protein
MQKRGNPHNPHASFGCPSHLRSLDEDRFKEESQEIWRKAIRTNLEIVALLPQPFVSPRTPKRVRDG